MCIILFIFLAILIALIVVYPNKKDGFDAKTFLKTIEKDIHKAEEIPDELLEKLKDRILVAKVPDTENFSFFYPANYTYWPQYYYSQNFDNPQQDPWPPGLFSRNYNWEPGYSSGSGWSFYMRPGVGYDKIQRSRWVKNNGKYYFINNGGLSDRKNDYYRMR